MTQRRVTTTLFVLLTCCCWGSAAWALDVEDVLSMASVGVPDSIIISTIESADDVFELSPDDIRVLRANGISDPVIAAMQATAPDTDDPPPTDPDGEPDIPGQDPETPEEDDEPIRGRFDRPRGDTNASDDEIPFPTSRTPTEIKEAINQHRARKFLSASYNLFNIIESDRYPEHELKARYYLADSLYRLELYHSAQVEFTRVVKAGRGTYHAPAVTRLVKIWAKTGDPSALAQLLDDLPPEDFPSKVRSDLMYLAGRKAFDNQEYGDALGFLGQVGARSDHEAQSMYVQAVILHRQGKLRSAAELFLEILKAKHFYGDPTEIERVEHLTLLNLGRIHYEVEQYEDATERFYEKMPRDSEYWADSLFEASWAYVQGPDDKDLALGHIRTLESPFYADRYWQPEVPILEAVIYYQLCEYEQVGDVLDRFEMTYQPVAEELARFVKPYADRELPPAHAYETLYTSGSDAAERLPTALYAHLESDQLFGGPHRHVLQIERELAQVDRMKARWRNSPLGDATVHRLQDDRERYMTRAGIVMLNDFNQIRRNLEGLLGQGSLLRYEMVAGVGDQLKNLAQGNTVVDAYEMLEFSYATEPEYVYWPFSGEYWSDELGYYHVPEKGSCTN